MNMISNAYPDEDTAIAFDLNICLNGLLYSKYKEKDVPNL